MSYIQKHRKIEEHKAKHAHHEHHHHSDNEKKGIMRWIIIFLVIIAVAFGGGYSYYKYIYTRTPSYTLTLIGKAVNEHNVDEFNRHVDVKSIVTTYLEEQYKKDPNLSSNPLAKVFWNALKNVAVTTVQASIDETVKGGDASSFITANGEENPLVQGVVSHNKEKSNLKLISVDEVKTYENGNIEVKVVYENTEQNKTSTLFLNMRPLADGTWQVYSIPNLGEILATDGINQAANKAGEHVAQKVTN